MSLIFSASFLSWVAHTLPSASLFLEFPLFLCLFSVWQACPSTGSCQLWKSPEIIKGMSDSTGTTPLLNTQGNVYPNLPVFESVFLFRVINFVYAGPTVFKSIALRHYVLDPAGLMNASTVPSNANYYQTVANGIAPLAVLNSGAPVFATMPVQASIE